MSGLKSIQYGMLRFTDGSFLDLGYRMETDENLNTPDYLYTKTSNPKPIYVLLRDNDTGNKIAGFTGEKKDVNGNVWSFSINGFSISKDETVLFTFTLPDTHNFYTISRHSLNNKTYAVATGTIPTYTNNPYNQIFCGVNNIAAGSDATTVYNDYFKNAETFYDTNLGTGFFINILSNSKNKFIETNFVMACHIKTGVALSPSMDTISFASSWIGINVDGLPDPEENPNDPYASGGTTDTGGGNGTFTGIGDTIPIPQLPSLSALNNGFITMYAPTAAQLTSLAQYLWTGAFDIDSFRKIFANPIDAFMGFGIVPLNPSIAGTVSVNVGNINTGIMMNKVATEFYEIDCGTLTLPERWGSYLDYEPYYQIECFLPYIGSVRVSTDDIKRQGGGTIKIVYHVNILDGSCTAYLYINGTTAYQYNGSILTQLPITGNDFRSAYQSILSLAGNIVGAVSSGVSGNAGAVLGNMASAAGNVMGSKPTINRSGSISGSNGRLGVQKPYLVLNEPKPAIAWAQNIYEGYPSHVTSNLNTLTGYNEFEKAYLNNIPATDKELDEIKSILESGVFL